MGVVCWRLARAALVDATAIGVAVAGFLVLVVWKPNSAWLVAAGAAVGPLRG